MRTPYQKILLKLSGEALKGTQTHGILPEQLGFYASELALACDLGVSIGIVIGGGNFYRGAQETGIARVPGDYMGMMATIMNGVALQGALESKGVASTVMSALVDAPLCEPYSQRRALQCLAQGELVIFVGGLGTPYFTTDSAASIRALEIGADVLLKGTSVDGVYTADPKQDAMAQRYDRVSFQEVQDKQLRVMDATAFTLCAENGMPIVVFDVNRPGNLCHVIQGKALGTLIH